MPTVTLNKKEVLKLIGKTVPDEILKEKISMLGTDLQELTKEEIVVEVFPNRPDLLSEQGMARALSTFLGNTIGLKKYKVNRSNYKVIIENSVNEVRPFTACAIVKNLKFTDEKIKEVIQIQEKLHVTFGRNRKKCAIGVYPFEKIKTPIYYKALKPAEIKFRPLEAEREMTGLEILSQHKTGREYGNLLEGKDKFPIFIDSNNQILSMPPIINSHEVGKITEKTKDIFVECSGFDFDVVSKCVNIIVCALADIGGDIYEIELNYGNKKLITPDLTPRKMQIDIAYTNKVLGLNLKEQEIKKYLEMMGYDYTNKTVSIPAYRDDILHQIDLVEDIAIAYGYSKFEPEIPKVATIAEENRLDVFKSKLADILIGLGLLEVHTFNITSKENQAEKTGVELEFVELANALSNEYNILRSWITPSLLHVLTENRHNEYPQNIFGFGEVFSPDKTQETKVKEQERLSIVLHDNNVTFTQIKQILDLIFRNLNINYVLQETKDHPSFIEGRCGRVSVKGKKIAYIGEIHPRVLKNFGLDYPVVALELNLSELFSSINR